MARRSRMSKKEFDDQFEAFLKESMSSEDSIDSARISKYLSPSKKKETTPWWMTKDDDDQEIGTGLSASGKSFLKKKRPEPENSTPIREDQTTSIRDKKPDLDSSDEGKKIVIQTDKRTKPKREGKPRGPRGKVDNSMSKDSLEDISEKSEEETTKGNDRRGLGNTKSSGEPSRNGRGTMPGLDTLDELAEKEKFFQDLEKNAEGSLDYSRLNRDLSQSATTMSPEGAAKAAATLAALEDIEQEDGALKPPPNSEPISHTDADPSIQKPSMLSKVSLMDSMESTMNTTGSPKIGGTLQEPQKESMDDVDGHAQIHQSTPGSFKTGTGGTGFMGTNTSQEIEALHKALREVGLSPTIKNDSQPLDSSTQGNNSELLQKILAAEPKSGKQRTVEEVLQEMEDIEKRGRDKHDDDVQLLSEKKKSPAAEKKLASVMDDMRGFGLSPIHQDDRSGIQQHDISSPRGFDQSHTEDTEMYQPVTQISISERGRTKNKEAKEKNKSSSTKRTQEISPQRSLSPKSSPRRWMSPRANTAELDRSRSLSPVKPGSTLKNKYNHVKSSGYGQQSPARNQTRERPSSAKETISSKPPSARDFSPKPSIEKTEKSRKHKKRDTSDKGNKKRAEETETWSPADVSRQKILGSESPVQSKGHTVGWDSQLRVSVESFAAYIKDHFTATQVVPQAKYSEDEPSVAASWKGEKLSDDLPGNVEELQNLIQTERLTCQRVKAELDNAKKTYERQLEKQKLEYEEEIFRLKQENYVLSAKVPGDELKKQVVNGTASDISKEQMEQLQKDLQEQESLITGYQQENKRLYDQLKNLQKQSKQTEERMFTENQKLLTELANIRDEEHISSEKIVSKAGLSHGPPLTDLPEGALEGGKKSELEAELREFRRKEITLKRELEISQRTKIQLEQQVSKLIKDIEALQEKLDKSSHPEDVRRLEDKFKEEEERLNRKLKWYAENQKILDKDAKKLKARDEEISQLKSRIEELQSETGKRLEENKMRSRERALDSKKIQDLQRQVKEMEQIMKRRHPNSLPSLMMTAAIIPEEQPSEKSPLIPVLEGRIRRLEEELRDKDQDEEKRLRAVEQKYNNIKIKYEERISDLEIQLAAYHRPDDQDLKEYEHPHTNMVALQRELDTTRERYKKQVTELQEQVAQLNMQLQKAKKAEEGPKTELQASKETELELNGKIRLLQLELDSKNHDLQVLHKSIERLRKEKQSTIMNGLGLDKNRKKKKNKGEQDGFEEMDAAAGGTEHGEMEKELSMQAKKISKLAQENENLKATIDQLQLESEHHRLEVHKSQAEHESYIRRSRESYEEKVEALCVSHQKELKQMLAQQALEHSASKMAQLQSKLNAQEVMVQHLREQLAKAQVELEQMSVLKIQEASLQTKVEKLQEELRNAKKFHSPGMKHFELIEDKILNIEKKHENREKELQQIIKNSKDAHTTELEEQTVKWKQVVESKNQEINRFRLELDSILDVLRLLQKQGVVLPVRTSGTNS